MRRVAVLLTLLILVVATCGCSDRNGATRESASRPSSTEGVRTEPGEGGDPAPASAVDPDEEKWTRRRLDLVKRLERQEIKDEKILAVMRVVRRHLFVPEAVREDAYANHPLPIGEGQTISSPYIVAFMTQALELTGEETVLEIGTGSGYQAAVLAKILPEILTIEIVPSLAASARRRLADLGYGNVRVRCGDGYKGWPERAPFDAIIVTAAPEKVPQALVDQLARGGRLVLPVGPQGGRQVLVLLRKDESGKVTEEHLLGVRFVPMVHER